MTKRACELVTISPASAPRRLEDAVSAIRMRNGDSLEFAAGTIEFEHSDWTRPPPAPVEIPGSVAGNREIVLLFEKTAESGTRVEMANVTATLNGVPVCTASIAENLAAKPGVSVWAGPRHLPWLVKSGSV